MRGKALKSRSSLRSSIRSRLVACAALALATTCACALAAKTPAKSTAKSRTPLKAVAAPVHAGRKPLLAVVHVSTKPAAVAKDRHGRLLAVARAQDVRKPLRAHAVAPEPAPEERPLDPIVVNHDRKRHYAADQVPNDGSLSPVLYNKRGRLIVPAAMKGSREILLRQNEVADAEGLDRASDSTIR
jgi:hypothetical protein